MRLTENKLRKIVREEIQNIMNESAGFREDRMRAFLDREPKLQRIYNQEGIDLKTMWDKYVVPNARMKRKYSHSL